MTKDRKIQFADYSAQSYQAAIKYLLDNEDIPVYFYPVNDKSKAFVKNLIAATNHDVLPLEIPESKTIEKSLILITTDDSHEVCDYLMKFIGCEDLSIIAPLTEFYFRNRPLFIVSIPKSGTHLLQNLLKEVGYQAGIEHNYNPKPGVWYCLEYSNTHTRADDFFIESVRKLPFGNRHHPFSSVPVLFMYRNPLDILVSEANYYHKNSKTLFSGYLSSLSFNERLYRLIDDKWLLGSIRDRIVGYLPWLDFQNVIPISFEELIGEQGRGSSALLNDLIWSLQLKLHIPGCTSDISENIYDKNSPTFSSGKIGTYIDNINEEHFSMFQSLNQDFMDFLGYGESSLESYVTTPKHIERYRKRPLVVEKNQTESIPILIETDYMDFNIVLLNNRYYGLPMAIGNIDLSSLEVKKLKLLPNSKNISELKHTISIGLEAVSLIKSWQIERLVPAINNKNKEQKIDIKHPHDLINKVIRFFWRKIQ